MHSLPDSQLCTTILAMNLLIGMLSDSFSKVP